MNGIKNQISMIERIGKQLEEIHDNVQKLRFLSIKTGLENPFCKKEYIDELNSIGKRINDGNGIFRFIADNSQVDNLSLKLDPKEDGITINLDKIKWPFFEFKTGGVKCSVLSSKIDARLEDLSLIRAQLGAWYNRLEYSSDIQRLLLEGNHKNISKIIEKIEKRVLTLLRWSALGKYSSNGREMLNIEFGLLIKELKRIDETYSMRSRFLSILNKEDNIKDIKSAAKLMKKLR